MTCCFLNVWFLFILPACLQIALDSALLEADGSGGC
jgi:hypothetical protein